MQIVYEVNCGMAKMVHGLFFCVYLDINKHISIDNHVSKL